MSFAHDIQSWFDKESGGSLFLPDGWYGRPYDNQHALTSVEESTNNVTMILDRKLILRFEGLKSVKATRNELTIGPFKLLRFESEGFGMGSAHSIKEYKAGEVKIFAGPA